MIDVAVGSDFLDSCARIAGLDFVRLYTRIAAAAAAVEHMEAVGRHSTAAAAHLAVDEADRTAGANTVVAGIVVVAAAAVADTGDSLHHQPVGFAARYEDYLSRFAAFARRFERGADLEAEAVVVD